MKACAFLAAVGVAVSAPALAAPADPHAGHHPADAATAPTVVAPPATAVGETPPPPKCPMMADMAKSMPAGSAPMKMGDKTMSPEMMEKCMKPAPATPAPDAHKHE